MPIEQPFIVAWFKFILVLLPIWLGGVYLIKIASSSKRFELILPAGLIAGVSLDIFLLNNLSFFIHPKASIIVSEIIFILLTLCLFLDRRHKEYEKISSKSKWLFISSLTLWGVYLFNRAGYTGFGGDVDIYYSIAKTFVQGNFPLKSPWQPDFMVDYHYGGSLLLGSLQFFTNLSFDFLHKATAFILLFCVSQMLVWGFKRHTSWISLLTYQLVPLIGLVGLGSFMVVWPAFPITSPNISSLGEFWIWISNFPAAISVFDVFGAPVVIEHFIYFYHHAVGLPIFLLILLLVFNYAKKWSYYIFLIVCLASLAIVNESYFIPALFASLTIIFYNILRTKSFSTEKFKFIISVVLLGTIVFFEGGTITNSLLWERGEERSMIFFPKREDFGERWGRYISVGADVTGVHLRQISSKLLEDKKEWQPLRWFHPGIFWSYFVAIILISLLHFLKIKGKIGIAVFLTFSSSLALFAYFAIIHKYVPSATSRLLTIAYQLIGVALIFCFLWIFESVYKRLNKMLKLIFIIACAWILIPSSLPPFLSIARPANQPNLLLKPLPKLYFNSAEWLRNHVKPDERVLDLIGGSYFTDRWGKRSDQRAYIQLSREAGVLTPLFGPSYRDLHFEASPEYLDALYTLNPSSLKQLKIDYMVLDDNMYEELPSIRKEEISNPQYFIPLYIDYQDPFHERVYRVTNEYLLKAQDLEGTFNELKELIPPKASVYLYENREIHSWNNIFKAIMLVLKDTNIYSKGTVGYMQVDVFYRLDDVEHASKFDYLILYKDTDPAPICNCQPQLIWQGLNSQIKVWKVI